MNRGGIRYLLGFVIVIPVFISIGGGVGFDRMGGFASSYFITIPASFLIVTAMFVLYLRDILNSRYILWLLVYLLFCILLKGLYIVGYDTSQIKNITWMMVFIVSNHVFCVFFYRVISQTRVDCIERVYIVRPLYFVGAVTLISYFFVSPRSFIIDSIKIYNFEQYYAFLFVLMLGVGAVKLKFYWFFFLVLVSFFVAIVSVNTSALLVMLVFVFAYVLYSMLPREFNKIIYNAIIVFSIVFFIVFPGVLFISFNYLTVTSNSIISRYNIIDEYFMAVEWYEILIPFFSSGRTVRSDMHNELLEVFRASGIIGLILYYTYIVRKIVSFTGKYRMVGVSIVLVIFVGGTMVENTLHPYMLIILSYLISFYYVASTISVAESGEWNTELKKYN